MKNNSKLDYKLAVKALTGLSSLPLDMQPVALTFAAGSFIRVGLQTRLYMGPI